LARAAHGEDAPHSSVRGLKVPIASGFCRASRNCAISPGSARSSAELHATSPLEHQGVSLGDAAGGGLVQNDGDRFDFEASGASGG
jgi:hypothetical protein